MPNSFCANAILSINSVSCVPDTYAYKNSSLQNWLSTIEVLILVFG